MSKPRLWKSRGWWVCGFLGKPLGWGQGWTPMEAYTNWVFGRLTEAAFGRFGGGRFGQ